MINFRFHIVSLVAIFLALALGVVVGAGVIDRGVVDALNNRLDRVEARSDDIRAERDAVSGERDELTEAVRQLSPHAVDAVLIGEDVTMIAVRGVDNDAVAHVVELAHTDGGADVPGILWIEDRFALEQEGDVEALAAIVGEPSGRASVVRRAAWQALAARLADGTSPTAGTDLLAALADEHFVSFDPGTDGAAIADVAGNDAYTVVVGTQGAVASTDIVLPFASALAAADLSVVVADVFDPDAEPPVERGASLARLRAGDVATSVSTVDDLDRPEGPVTVVLALAGLLGPAPAVGHYGLGPDTTLMPAPVS
jgi:Copper transport outer membrane protein, MctB